MSFDGNFSVGIRSITISTFGVLIAVLILVPGFPMTSAKVAVGSHHGNPLGPIIKCERDQETFLRWICDDSGFKFPFKTRSYSMMRHLPKPNPRRFPFQYQSSKCCVDGCKLKEYQLMCRYHSAIMRCKESNPRSRKNICTVNALNRIRLSTRK